MITEEQLERALELRSEIKELKVKLSRLKNASVSRVDTIGAKFSIDSNMIDMNPYTLKSAEKFLGEVVRAYESNIRSLEKEYEEIVTTEADIIEQTLLGDEDEF